MASSDPASVLAKKKVKLSKDKAQAVVYVAQNEARLAKGVRQALSQGNVTGITTAGTIRSLTASLVSGEDCVNNYCGNKLKPVRVRFNWRSTNVSTALAAPVVINVQLYQYFGQDIPTVSLLGGGDLYGERPAYFWEQCKLLKGDIVDTNHSSVVLQTGWITVPEKRLKTIQLKPDSSAPSYVYYGDIFAFFRSSAASSGPNVLYSSEIHFFC